MRRCLFMLLTLVFVFGQGVVGPVLAQSMANCPMESDIFVAQPAAVTPAGDSCCPHALKKSPETPVKKSPLKTMDGACATLCALMGQAVVLVPPMDAPTRMIVMAQIYPVSDTHIKGRVLALEPPPPRV